MASTIWIPHAGNRRGCGQTPCVETFRAPTLKTLHVDRLDPLCRHRDVPSFPVSSPAASSMARVSRSCSLLIHELSS